MGNHFKYIFYCILFGILNTASADVTLPLIIEEEDGSPSVVPYKIKITNGDLTDNADGTVSIDTSGTATAPGGSDTYVQYNDSSAFGGDAGLVYDENNDYLTAKGGFILGSGVDQNETMLTVDRASTDVVISWDETNDEIDINYPLNIAGTGSTITFSGGSTIDGGSTNKISIDNLTETAHLVATGGFETYYNIVKEPKFMRFNLWDPNAMYDDDETVCIASHITAQIEINEIYVTLDADPTTELSFDLMYADAFIDHPNAVVIANCNTTSGSHLTSTVNPTFDTSNDAHVVANKCMFIRFDGDPDSSITQVGVNIQYFYD